MAAVDLHLERAPAADRQPGGMVHRRDRPATLGGIWIAEDFGCLVESRYGQPDHFFPDPFHRGVLHIICLVPFPAESENSARTDGLWWQGGDGRRRPAG